MYFISSKVYLLFYLVLFVSQEICVLYFPDSFSHKNFDCGFAKNIFTLLTCLGYLLAISSVSICIIINVPAIKSSKFCVTRNMFTILLGIIFIKRNLLAVLSIVFYFIRNVPVILSILHLASQKLMLAL